MPSSYRQDYKRYSDLEFMVFNLFNKRDYSGRQLFQRKDLYGSEEDKFNGWGDDIEQGNFRLIDFYDGMPPVQLIATELEPISILDKFDNNSCKNTISYRRRVNSDIMVTFYLFFPLSNLKHVFLSGH